MYESICGSWLFNAAHFTARLVETKYAGRMEERTPHWMHFIKEWLPERYPDRQDSMSQSADLRAWYEQTRTTARDKIFTMFPQVAEKYYIKRGAHMKELEEHRLRGLIMQCIPEGVHGWKDDFPQPPISSKEQELPILDAGELTPPLTPTIPVEYPVKDIASDIAPGTDELRPQDVRLYLDPLDRTPPFEYVSRPPPATMSKEAKLQCLARWTEFDPESGTPRLLGISRPKTFDMHWSAAAYAGATDEVLQKWAQTMWWHIWIRQSHVNFIGMWKKRFEKDDRKTEKARQEEDAAKMKILGRLQRLNASLGETFGADRGC